MAHWLLATSSIGTLVMNYLEVSPENGALSQLLVAASLMTAPAPGRVAPAAALAMLFSPRRENPCQLGP